MRILVCGSRDWPGTWEDIAIHLPESGDVTIIHGACSRRSTRVSFGRAFHNVQVSVDMLADFAARGLGLNVEPYPVDHALDGPWPAAGPRRNARMLHDGAPTRAIAFGAIWHPAKTAGPNPYLTKQGKSKTTGTGDMVRRLLAAWLPVRWVPAPGEPAQDLTSMPDPVTP